ncbi:hypothetical protein HY417_01225 [Candidatus Kaiserbacteria bacterium]|nr:hypothetical protein [Candidatus Kaiserbacteria bacterium]
MYSITLCVSKLRAYLPGAYEIALFIIVVALVWMWGLRPEDMVLAFIGYTIVVLGLNDTFFSRGIRKALHDIRQNVLKLVLVGIICTLLLIWGASSESTIFLGTFFAFLLYEWDSRVLAGAALVSLGGCIAFLLFNYEADAEQMAIYAYYFLVMTVVLQIIEYKRHPDRFAEEEARKEADRSPLDLRSHAGLR